jgi:flagellar biosynthesis/type III secretory pathway chaperone
MNTLTQEIDQTLDSIINHSRTLIDILENEKLLLTENNYEKLERNAQSKKSNVDNLESACELLKNYFNKLSLKFNKEGLNELINGAPSNLQEDLQRKTKLMLDFLARAENLNHINGILVVSRHNYNQQLLSFITNTKKQETYGPYQNQQVAVSTRETKA